MSMEQSFEPHVPLIRLHKNDQVVIDEVWYRETHRTKHAVTLHPIGGTLPRVFTGRQLRELYFDPAKRMRIVRGPNEKLDPEVAAAASRPFESFSAGQQAEMLKRYDYVLACDRFFARKLFTKRPETGYARIAEIVARYRRLVRAHQENRPSCRFDLETVGGSTLRDWYGRWLHSGRQLGALAPLLHSRGSKEKKMDPAVRALIADCVNEKYLTAEAPPLTVVWDYICGRIDDLNEDGRHALAKPSEMAVRRWIKDNVDPFTEVFYRKGRKKATHQFRLTNNAPLATRPLQIVEFDETPLDIMLVDDNGKNPRRAVLTAGICVATGMIVGWHIGYEHPSWVTVMKALRMAVLAKDTSGSGAESPYPVYGVPEMIKVDNGPAYRSHSLVAAAGQLQFEIRLCPVAKPNLKGKVERFFREVTRDFLSIFPGRTFSNIQERGDYDSEGNARMTLQTVQRLFTRWVVDIYHNRPNSRCFGQTPLERWEALSGFGVRVPPQSDDLTPLIGLIVNRTIQADGITFMGLTYRDAALKLMRQKSHMGREWMVKIDPNDLRWIYILNDEAQCWVRAGCQRADLIEGLSLKMWMEVVKAAKEATAARQRVSIATLRRARVALLREAEAMGNKPHGKITARDQMWIEANMNQPAYLISVDPDELDAMPNRMLPRRRAKPAENEAKRDPSMVEPASRAGGHPIADQDLPDAPLDVAERELDDEVREQQERDDLRQWRKRAAALSSAVSTTQKTDAQPLRTVTEAAPPIIPDQQEDVSQARQEAPVGAFERLATAACTRTPTRLADEDDIESWNPNNDQKEIDQ
ncbi:Integrase, catalytic region [Rhodopseudomonas palustris BisB5]|uniref:Integrase, catalytic region n=1 Tax=Rhodopseudomonas palustris (strain BisB5) TaxID=316057 RepID=Q13F74_RHOPS|nr:Integrase, catalytic region [Rhodopseudomonas palustris BisB5]